MTRQKKLTQKFFSALWPPLSPNCTLCISIMHGPDLSRQQEYLLSHKQQHSPSINKTTF